MSAVALDEYTLGVQNGRIISRPELDEAETFLGEARKRALDLSPHLRDLAVPALDSILAGVARRVPDKALRVRLDRLRKGLEDALGAALDLLPSAAPSLARGARVYQLRCAECHGDAGRGDGPKAARMDPPPANFTDLAALSNSSPLDFFRKVSVGIAGTEMREWESLLSLDDRWAVALFATTLRYTDQQRAAGKSLLRDSTRLCAACLEVAGDFSATASVSDDSLTAVLMAQLGGIPDSSRAAATAYARSASSVEELGGDPVHVMDQTLARTRAALDEAEALAGRGATAEAEARALDAYLVFERIEAGLRARDAGAAVAAEGAFRGFRATVASGSPAQAHASRLVVESSLVAARAVLTAPSGSGVLFGQSLLIMLREGLEAILIIGALMAVVVKAGAPERKRDLLWGVLAALAASLATAALMVTIFREYVSQREALEGFVMIAAAAVLFSVSYWLISKIEAKKWQAFVGGKVKQALTAGGSFALAAVAFLAVYREGFETVLFYAALYASGSGPGSTASVTGGMLTGFVVLAGVYYAIQRWGVRLPLKPIFGVTSTLLYLMAFSFAGQGIAELQEAGMVSVTPLSWMPSIPALGIFPTIQTVGIQAVLAAAVVAALAWVFWLEPRRS